MSRSGYSEDLDVLDLGRWRGQVKSAIRGRRGQEFFRALIAALDAMPEKRLIAGDLQEEESCEVCALGALAKHKGINPLQLDTYDYDAIGKTFNIAHQLAQEVMYENDEFTVWEAHSGRGRDSPERRWQYMRDWAAAQLLPVSET